MAHISSFVLFCGIYLNIVGSNLATKSGHYITNLVRVEKCANPTQPYEKHLSGDVTLELYKMGKKILLRGNYTSYKPDSGIKLSIRDYFLVNDQWKPTFSIVGINCHGWIPATLGSMFSINFNKKTCAAPKGVYSFTNIDYDLVDHLLFVNHEYGKVLRKVEAFTKKGTVVCVELEAVTTPKNH